MSNKPIATKTFTDELVREGSWGRNDIGKHESTMDLYMVTETHGFIEWDIPSIETTETIGLWFDLDDMGEPILIDYDGIFSLPAQAVELIESAGFRVPEDMR